eukprot:TRINITY_DN4363_c0_g1_i5.p2 TRINITY_DN4363_c0_g1~~TRINITY_DN4363_c0_g1_i5.p2  ORF type:complete len:194 (+),score=-15.80 TRINITY_DN4363_c0_g1_i5:754-1335(+)
MRVFESRDFRLKFISIFQHILAECNKYQNFYLDFQIHTLLFTIFISQNFTYFLLYFLLSVLQIYLQIFAFFCHIFCQLYQSLVSQFVSFGIVFFVSYQVFFYLFNVTNTNRDNILLNILHYLNNIDITRIIHNVCSMLQWLRERFLNFNQIIKYTKKSILFCICCMQVDPFENTTSQSQFLCIFFEEQLGYKI